MNSACGQRVSVMMFCRWGVVGGVRFVCLALDVVGRLVVSPGLEARRTRLAPRPSEGGCSTVGEGAWTARSNASAAPLCGRAWCSGGVCKPGSRSGRATMDVIGRLVVSPGLEARRTRLAPRPSGGTVSAIGWGCSTIGGGKVSAIEWGCSTIGGTVSAIGWGVLDHRGKGLRHRGKVFEYQVPPTSPLRPIPVVRSREQLPHRPGQQPDDGDHPEYPECPAEVGGLLIVGHGHRQE